MLNPDDPSPAAVTGETTEAQAIRERVAWANGRLERFGWKDWPSERVRELVDDLETLLRLLSAAEERGIRKAAARLCRGCSEGWPLLDANRHEGPHGAPWPCDAHGLLVAMGVEVLLEEAEQ